MEPPHDQNRSPLRSPAARARQISIGVVGLVAILGIVAAFAIALGRFRLGEGIALAAKRAEPAAGSVAIGPLGLRFRWVPSGHFAIGSPEEEPGRSANERQRTVEIRGLWLAETETTEALWRRLTGRDPEAFPRCGDDCPVVDVTWIESAWAANLLSRLDGRSPCYRLEGAADRFDGVQSLQEALQATSATPIAGCTGYRLPSEEEWEVAARAGTVAATYAGPFETRSEHDEPILERIAWYGGNSGATFDGAVPCERPETMAHPATLCGPHPVAQKRPNPWGFFDLLGNAFEWTESESLGDLLVVRGGSWSAKAHRLRAAYRRSFPPTSHWDALGFRLARSADLEDFIRAPQSAARRAARISR